MHFPICVLLCSVLSVAIIERFNLQPWLRVTLFHSIESSTRTPVGMMQFRPMTQFVTTAPSLIVVPEPIITLASCADFSTLASFSRQTEPFFVNV